jgi:ribosomal protein S18 acetylase RimI-like enzyme
VLTLRQASTDDVAELRAIAAEAYAIYIPRIGRPPAPVTADYAAAVARREAWAAVDDQIQGEGKILGLVVLVARPDHLLLENIAVRPSAQRRGIGARLLTLAEQEAARLGLGEIRLYTHVTMTENQAYYPRHGYRLTHRAEQDGFQRVFFTKRLATA